MKRLWLAATFGFTSLCMLFMPAFAHADVNYFTITNFSGDYYLSHDDPQGALDIHEQMTADFTDENHGILRAIPENYNGMPLHIHVEKVAMNGTKERYTTSTSNGNLVLKIGDPNTTVTGAQSYEIDYKVVNVMRFVNGHDELDWNVNGTEWDQPFLNVKATLHLPLDLQGKATDAACFTGEQGSTASDCRTTSDNGQADFSTNSMLEPGETLTFKADFPNGSFAKPTFKDWWADHGTHLLELLVPIIVTIFFAGRWWYKNGKDIKGRGTIVPEYGPPDDLRAAETDVIMHYKIGNNAISATIIDLAIRKYLRIEEEDTKSKLGGKHKKYSFIRLPLPTQKPLKDYEAQVMNGLFTSGDTINTNVLRISFYATTRRVQKLLPNDLTTAGYFPKDPTKVGVTGYLIGIPLFGVGCFCFGFATFLAIGLILSAAIVAFFTRLMPKRTQKGVDAKDAIEGLKLYLNVAEKDRIAMLQSPDAPYAAKSDAPKKTVELFEKLLPYAMVLGVEKQWAKQFETIYTTPPDWYSGNWATFNAVYFTSSLSESMSAMNTSFAAPPSSSGGSGGGFAGGGGGGGGGGGW